MVKLVSLNSQQTHATEKKHNIQLNNRYLLTEWKPDDPSFWQEKGKSIAQRNLWISIPCLLLSFSVWMMFSAIAVNLPKVGFDFSTDQLFMLTALPSLSGAIGRIPYSFVIPIFGGRRWTAISTIILLVPTLWLGFAVQNPTTPYSTFVIIALLCGLAGSNFASSMANISFFFPKEQQGRALGLNGGLGNLGVSIMQILVPIVISVGIFNVFGSKGVELDSGTLWLANGAWLWVPFILILSIIAWFGMNDLNMAKSSFLEQASVLKQKHLWLLSILYLSAFGSFIGFSAGFAMLANTQFPEVDIMTLAFIGPLIGALMRPIGGGLSDRVGGVKVTLTSFILMACLTLALFISLPSNNQDGNFILFLFIFLGLFACAGAGSGSTFQMIAVLFRQIMVNLARKQGVSEKMIPSKSSTDTAAALGFISAIGAIGGFFIPKAFGTSLALTDSPVNAMKIFFIFYVICALITWLIYGRNISTVLAAKK